MKSENRTGFISGRHIQAEEVQVEGCQAFRLPFSLRSKDLPSVSPADLGLKTSVRSMRWKGPVCPRLKELKAVCISFDIDGFNILLLNNNKFPSPEA